MNWLLIADHTGLDVSTPQVAVNPRYATARKGRTSRGRAHAVDGPAALYSGLNWVSPTATALSHSPAI